MSNMYDDQLKTLNERLEAYGQELAELLQGQAQPPEGLTLGERVADLLTSIQTDRSSKPALQQKSALVSDYQTALALGRELSEQAKQMDELLRRVNAFQKDVETAARQAQNARMRPETAQRNIIQSLMQLGVGQDELNDIIGRARESSV